MPAARPRRTGLLCRLGLCLGWLLCGCWSNADPHVVVYTALDAEFSQPIFADYQAATGAAVRPKFDVESTKTVGLTTAILGEAARPRCDVFWNNEIVNTLRLADAGLLEPYVPASAADFPSQFRDPQGRWHGFAARARVIIVNTRLLAEGDRPRSIRDLTHERFRGKVAIAKPLFGTTATHAACLFAVLGEEPAKDYFRQLKANGVQIAGGNKQVALSVAAGEAWCGLTDTDDAMIELEHGRDVAIIYPDSQPGELGTLFIPNTLAIIKGGPHPELARKLVDYLLTTEVELKLAASPSAQIPLSGKAAGVKLRVETPATIQAMQVDFQKAAEQWDKAAKFLRDEFTAE